MDSSPPVPAPNELQTGGVQYEAIVAMFQLSLCLSLDNACCERGFSAMNGIKTAKRNKLDKSLFLLMLLAMHGNSFKSNYEKMGVAMAATWAYNDWVVYFLKELYIHKKFLSKKNCLKKH